MVGESLRGDGPALGGFFGASLAVAACDSTLETGGLGARLGSLMLDIGRAARTLTLLFASRLTPQAISMAISMLGLGDHG